MKTVEGKTAKGRMGRAAAIVSAIVLLTTGATAAGTSEATRQPGTVAGINVYFKLDPRLTQGLYMGERWVSPPTYSRVGESMPVVVDASAKGVDGRGKAVRFQPEWRAEDPGMVTVTPTQGNDVKISVLRPGTSHVVVSSQGVSRQLAINAKTRDKAIIVEITQK